jgi:hypothetical protein
VIGIDTEDDLDPFAGDEGDRGQDRGCRSQRRLDPEPIAQRLRSGHLLLAAVLGKFLGAGSPTDVDPSLGDLQPIKLDPNTDKPLAGADIVYVRGTWVYDSLHEGWNEIHPVKVCAKVGTWTGDWATQPPIDLSKVRV